MDSWDNEDFEVTMPTIAKSVADVNKCEGEDEDDDVKDSWDDLEEEKKDEDTISEVVAASTKPKKALIRKIDEKEGDKEMRKKQGTLVPTGENLTIPIRRKKPKAKKAEKSVLDNKEITNTPGVLIISTGPEPRKETKIRKRKPMPIHKSPKPLQLHSWPILSEKRSLRVKTMPLPRKSIFRNLTKPKGIKIPENNIMKYKHRALITTITREHTTKPVPNNNKPGTSVPKKKKMSNETGPLIITTEENLKKPVTKKKAKKNKLEKSVPGNKEMIDKPGSLINTTEENMTKPVTKKNKLEKIEMEKKEITNETGPPIITTEENLKKPVTKKKAKKNKLEKSVPGNKEMIDKPGSLINTTEENMTKPVTKKKAKKNKLEKIETDNKEIINTPEVLIISTEPEPRKKAKKQKQLLCKNKEMINTPGSLITAAGGNLKNTLTKNQAKKLKKQKRLKNKETIYTPGFFLTAAGGNLEKPLTKKQAKKIEKQNRLEQFKLKWPKLNEATSFRVKTKRFPRTSLFKKMKKPRGIKTPERFIHIPLRWKISPYGGKPKQTQEEIDLMKKQKKEGKELQMVTDLLDKFFGNKRELIERQVIKKGIRKQEVNDKHAQWARSAKKRFSVFSSINNL